MDPKPERVDLEVSPWSEKKHGWLSNYRTRKNVKPPDDVDVKPAPRKTKANANAVYYIPVRCPICKSKKCPVHTSNPPIRYHRCENGHNFKSVEK